MWISKDAEERKKELLDASLCLFYEKGYGKTTINDIIKKVGVTKGAFYYYFKSMDDVVESIALNEANKLIKVAKKYAEDKDLNALEKINGLISEALQHSKTNLDHRVKYYGLLQDIENAKVMQLIHKNVFELSFPIIRAIIEQGMREGVFKIISSDDAAEFYIQLTAISKHSIMGLLNEMAGKPEVNEVITRKLNFYQQILETVLGAEKGTLRLCQ